VEIVDESSPGISTEDMEKMVQDSNEAISQVREEMRASVAELATEMTSISTAVKKQNAVVVGV
jgi:methyl-accepting chemotaxis protein